MRFNLDRVERKITMLLNYIVAWASVSTILFGAFFILYLEFYARMTGLILTIHHPWRINAVPYLALVISLASGLVTLGCLLYKIISI